MTYIRWITSIALCYGVYGETGMYTTTAIALIMITSEAELQIMKRRKS